eukprot:CAMPEP_0168785012 /NCGR_PEP_ID=MMETSP0725-20121227/10521_1 /TAXON_ID=265536 /ORGANISM="Amphiprora sp., Strain CCMP467" /LENGTH=210 /DNA_ID=CAMNT_0008835085 /DNA_START=173 /DNA_END=802 /DNA_ORIENTATION=+
MSLTNSQEDAQHGSSSGASTEGLSYHLPQEHDARQQPQCHLHHHHHHHHMGVVPPSPYGSPSTLSSYSSSSMAATMPQPQHSSITMAATATAPPTTATTTTTQTSSLTPKCISSSSFASSSSSSLRRSVGSHNTCHNLVALAAGDTSFTKPTLSGSLSMTTTTSTTTLEDSPHANDWGYFVEDHCHLHQQQRHGEDDETMMQEEGAFLSW